VALDNCANDDSIRVLTLTGAGRGFCAGANLSTGGGAVSSSTDSDDMIDHVFNPVIRKLIDMPIPTICQVNGVAAGGGFGIALSCVRSRLPVRLVRPLNQQCNCYTSGMSFFTRAALLAVANAAPIISISLTLPL